MPSWVVHSLTFLFARDIFLSHDQNNSRKNKTFLAMRRDKIFVFFYFSIVNTGVSSEQKRKQSFTALRRVGSTRLARYNALYD